MSSTATASKRVIDAYGSVSNSLKSGSLTLNKTPDEMRSDGEIVDYTLGDVRYNADQGKAEVYISKSAVTMATDETTAIALSDGCAIMDARVHMTRTPHDIRIAGFWVLNEEILTGIPSTLANPVPTLVFKYPAYAKKAAKLMKLISGS